MLRIVDHLPSRRDVNRAIYELEIGFWEANWMRGYYAELRFRRWTAQPFLHFGDSAITPQDVVKFFGLFAATIVFVILWLTL